MTLVSVPPLLRRVCISSRRQSSWYDSEARDQDRLVLKGGGLRQHGFSYRYRTADRMPSLQVPRRTIAFRIFDGGGQGDRSFLHLSLSPTEREP